MRARVLLLALAACDDHVFPVEEVEVGDGWCGVQEAFAASCLSCHSAALALGDLDLESDAHAAIVGVTSAAYGDVLVAPGDPEGSLLFRKIGGTQAADEGTAMPPTAGLDEATVAVFRDWIAGGADDVCASGGGGGGGGQGVHPEGWAFPDVHGLATKLQTDADCRTCHGERLEGGDLGAGIACDDCHYDEEWEANCTFCHGGVEDTTGAPPEDIDDRSDELSFPPHTVHVTRTIHAPFDCEQCHAKPQDALTPGHLFDDDTPGRAEVAFAGGLSPQGAWDGNGTCSNVYCHGNGRQNGDATVGEQRTCQMCHADATLGGEHGEHLGSDDGPPIVCADCHADVVDTALAIVEPALHVDGEVSVTMATVTRTGDRCTGACHGEAHDDAEHSW